jgi:hypothetical protein
MLNMETDTDMDTVMDTVMDTIMDTDMDADMDTTQKWARHRNGYDSEMGTTQK